MVRLGRLLATVAVLSAAVPQYAHSAPPTDAAQNESPGHALVHVTAASPLSTATLPGERKPVPRGVRSSLATSLIDAEWACAACTRFDAFGVPEATNELLTSARRLECAQLCRFLI